MLLKVYTLVGSKENVIIFIQPNVLYASLIYQGDNVSTQLVHGVRLLRSLTGNDVIVVVVGYSMVQLQPHNIPKCYVLIYL